MKGDPKSGSQEPDCPQRYTPAPAPSSPGLDTTPSLVCRRGELGIWLVLLNNKYIDIEGREQIINDYIYSFRLNPFYLLHSTQRDYIVLYHTILYLHLQWVGWQRVGYSDTALRAGSVPALRNHRHTCQSRE